MQFRLIEYTSTMFIKLCHFCFEVQVQVQVGLKFKSKLKPFSQFDRGNDLFCMYILYIQSILQSVTVRAKNDLYIVVYVIVESRNSNTKWVMDMCAVSGVVPNKTHHRNRVQVITFFLFFFLLSFILSTSLSVLYTQSILLELF